MNFSSFLQWIIKNKFVVLGFFTLCLVSFFYFSLIFSFRFVDEEDNLVLGHFLLAGQRLYSDLFSHHQPFGYLLSALIQLVTQPQNIYSLIQYHRVFMIAWALLWGIGLILRFGKPVVFPLIIFEISKFYLLGNLFLSESLAVYPLMYLILIVLESKKKYPNLEIGWSGFLLGFCALMLAPLWPVLVGWLFFLFWFRKILFRQFIYLFIGIGISVVLVLPFIDLQYYYRNVIYINFKYYIPQSAEEKMPLALIKSFFSPITIWITESKIESSATILKGAFFFLVISLGYLLKKKQFKLVAFIITVLTLANIRYYSPGLDYKAGFHLLIWYALFLLIIFYFIGEIINSFRNQIVRLVFFVGLFCCLASIIFISRDLFLNHDLKADFEKNYSQSVVFGQAIQAIRQEGDTLFVIPDEWLLYYQGNVGNFDRMVNFYPWMSLVWELNDPIVGKFSSNPPAFFYCECPEETVLAYSDQYRQMIRHGAKTSLWVLNDRFVTLNDQQKTKLRTLNFQLE